jgi:hypothetical protein
MVQKLDGCRHGVLYLYFPFLTIHDFMMMPFTISCPTSGLEVTVVIIMCFSDHTKNMLDTCRDAYAKREYDPFLAPSPCRMATTPSVIAVGRSLLFQYAAPAAASKAVKTPAMLLSYTS